MISVAILGSTGSIGTQTLDVVEWHKGEYKIDLLSANKNINLLEEQILKYNPSYAVVMDFSAGKILADRLSGHACKVFCGMEGMLEAIKSSTADIVVTALTGVVGLRPTMCAITMGKHIALANKETLVAAGPLVMDAAKKHKINIIPVDSEHSAIFQCMQGEKKEDIESLILTASGGPFRQFKKSDLSTVTPEMALKHPNWNMGGKISIDSATMMNKGLEVIEAKWLFGVANDMIDVIIHPESIVHSMVQYRDGSVLAHLGVADMRIPIQYALTYPNRKSINKVPRLKLTEVAKLTFQEPDIELFPCLGLAYDAMKVGGTMPTVMNGANEIAVEMFLKNEIMFNQISKIIAYCMDKHHLIENPSLDDIISSDEWARKSAIQYLKRIKKVVE